MMRSRKVAFDLTSHVSIPHHANDGVLKTVLIQTTCTTEVSEENSRITIIRSPRTMEFTVISISFPIRATGRFRLIVATPNQ